MKLYKLLKNIKCRVYGSMLVEISGLYHNDKNVQAGGLFFCIEGVNFCGEDYVKTAIKNGAVAIVSNKELKGIDGITQIIVKDVRKTMSKLACEFFGNPANNLKIIGVTGTNGKTTTTHLISNMFESLGKSCGLIGTNGVKFAGKIIETGMTTPDPIELQQIFSKMVKEKIEYVCMEVSAHACFLNKLDGFVFEIMVFTNLTEDHLDFFSDMENYYEAKKKIFTSDHVKTAIINVDDEYGKRLNESINLDRFTYAIDSEADFKVERYKLNRFKQEFYFNNKNYFTDFIGKFNIYNLLSSVAVMKTLQINICNLQALLNNLKPVAGRFNTIIKNGKLFVVDYAHTPDGLENVLKVAKQIVGNKKLICLFGCGGNRETQKRLKMGEISSIYADLTIISSDNPRFEDRLKIAQDIEKGVTNSNYKIILDRKEAIKFANKISNEGDLILVAGKGAENYIDENGIKLPYSDFDEINNLE